MRTAPSRAAVGGGGGGGVAVAHPHFTRRCAHSLFDPLPFLPSQPEHRMARPKMRQRSRTSIIAVGTPAALSASWRLGGRVKGNLWTAGCSKTFRVTMRSFMLS